MVGEELRLVGHQFGEALFERTRNALMPLAPAAQQQTLVGGAPHQRVLEAVAAFQAAPFRKDDARRDQLVERGVERCTVPGGDRDKQREAELPADDRGDLRHLARLVEAVEPGHQ